jgi:hypothetical protein
VALPQLNLIQPQLRLIPKSKLELRFVRRKEIAKFFRHIEQAHPLLVVERYGEAAKTVDTDTALITYPKPQTSARICLSSSATRAFNH